MWEPFGSCLRVRWKFFSYDQHIFLYYLIKSPRTTIALTFLTNDILGIECVTNLHGWEKTPKQNPSHCNFEK